MSLQELFYLILTADKNEAHHLLIEKNTLNHLHKTEQWLENVLRKKNLTLKDIFYSFYKNKKIYIIKKSRD